MNFFKKDIKNNLRFYITILFLVIGFLLLNSTIKDLDWSISKTYRECRDAQSYCEDAQSDCEDTAYYCEDARSDCDDAQSYCEDLYYGW